MTPGGRLSCPRCGTVMRFEAPGVLDRSPHLCCPACNHRVPLISRDELAQREHRKATAYADVQAWLARQPKRGRPVGSRTRRAATY